MAATAAEKAAAAREAAVRKAAEKAKASGAGQGGGAAAASSRAAEPAARKEAAPTTTTTTTTTTADADDRQLSKEFIASVKHALTSSSGGEASYRAFKESLRAAVFKLKTARGEAVSHALRELLILFTPPIAHLSPDLAALLPESSREEWRRLLQSSSR